MSKKSLNHNRQFMFGIMAMGMVVIIVTIVFWMWCFPDGKKADTTGRAYSIELASGFAGDSVRVYLNDSIVLEKTVPADGETVQVPRTAEQNIVAVENPVTGESQLLNIRIEKGRLLLRKSDKTVVMEEIPTD